MKHLILIALLFSLPGCSWLTAVSSGGSELVYSKTEKDLLGRPRLESKKTTSKSAEIYSHASEAIKNLPPTVVVDSLACGGVTFETIKELANSAQARAFECLTAHQANRPMEILGQALVAALSDYRSDAHAIFAEATQAVQAVQNGAVAKWQSVMGMTKTGLIAGALSRAVTNGQDAQRDQAISAAENSGDISVGRISSDQYVSSGTSSSSAHGGGGELASTTGGAMSNTTSATRDGNTQITIARDATVADVRDNAQSSQLSDRIVHQAPSSNSAQFNDESATVAPQTADDLNDAPDTITNTQPVDESVSGLR